jgi:Domain of Unknown Function (DUF1206)
MADVTRLDWIAKLGFLARAIVYILLGYIALNISSKAGEGQNAVFDMLREMPGGRALLIVTAAGLVAYGIFRLFSAFLDLDGKGGDWKGLAQRAGQFISAITHMLLGYTAYTYISRLKQSAGGDEKTQEAARTILDLPMGTLLLGLIGLYLLGNAASQAVSAVKASFMRQIDPAAPQVTRLLGRIGFAARAALFAVIGWSLIQAAWFESQARARALGGALESLRGNEVLYAAVAGGLLIFGLFSLVLARYRIVPRIDVADTVKQAAQGNMAPSSSRR